MELNKLTLTESFEGLRKKEFSSEELTKSCFDQIKKFDDKINSFLTLNESEALAKAKEVDKKIKNDESISPLAGIPVAVKDIFCTAGLKTTSASKILENYIPPFDASVVAKLKKEDAVILGNTNLDEFAMGGSTENSGFFPTHNPWDLDRVPGGSSGGSAAALSADMGIYALGTDTGGSIREPASFCGVSGLKVSYGRVSRYGVMAMTSSLDTIGPFGKSAEDIAMILKYMAGRDEKDSTTPDVLVDNYSEEIKKEIRGLKVGLPKEYFVDGMDDSVRDMTLAAAKKLEEMGAEIVY